LVTFAATLVLAWGASAAGGVLHAPHDSVYSIAAAKLPNGLTVTVTVGTESAVLFSYDDGLSWQMLSGDGLELETPWEVTYHPGLPAAGGIGLFVIGTERGAWTWDPVADVVAELSTGLGANDQFILDLDSPLAGSDGPVMALTEKGGVYLLSPATMSWQLVHNTGFVFAHRGGVAIAPRFDSTSAAPRARDLYVAASGRLWGSRDAGASWQIHPGFPTTSVSITDWCITVLALSEDYANDGILMLGRVKQDPAFGADRGEIHRSGNGGTSFNLVRQLGSGVMSLVCTPIGPTGVRTWMAATRSYPNLGTFQGIGIMLSTDTGFSWDDWGNDQDFLMEDNPGRLSGYIPLNYEQQLTVMPDYLTRGEVMYGRQEGLFVTHDSGRHWIQRQMRVEREFRDVRAARTHAGDTVVFGAGYGVGTMMHVPAFAYVDELRYEPQMIYTRRLDVSPNYEFDGNVIVVGNVTMWCWQSDRVAPANPNLKSLWWQPANRDALTMQKLTGFPREVAYSPHFDGRGVPGSDQTYFWNSWDFGPYRSENNGTNAKALHVTSTGGVAGEMSCFAIAPTYDAAGARTDAYAGDEKGRLYKLVNEKWKELGDFIPMVEDMVISPNWSRPAEPVLYVALAGPPYVAEVRDDPSGLGIFPLNAGLPEVSANGLCAHPDFANTPVLYLSTFGSGIWRLDLAAPSPAWTPVGVGFPRLWARDVDASPNFTTDQMLFTATQDGIWACRDLPGEAWTRITTRGTRDDVDESFQYYQPNDPANPEFDHAWPWMAFNTWNLPTGVNGFGEKVKFTIHDGSFITTFATCRTLELMTFAGPRMGSVLIRAVHPDTEVLIKSVSVDLGAIAGGDQAYRVPVDLGGFRRVKLYISGQLDPGELFAFDGVEFRD
jgi:hypothetical protein